MTALRFTIDDANRAGDEWGFNCGPAAICAILGKTPAEVRPHLGDFERPGKGYTNPTLMFETLRRLGATWVPVIKTKTDPSDIIAWPKLGLVRIQWEGPWTEPGVPMAARYRQTHWIGARRRTMAHVPGPGIEVFDVNCMSVGGWVTLGTWGAQVVPWIIAECVPRANGRWHQTHVLELAR